MKQSVFPRFLWFVGSVLVCLSPLFLGASNRQQATSQGPSVLDATTWKYFPQPTVHDLMPYNAQFLNSADEPSLLPTSQDPPSTSYRFEAWLMPTTNVRVIRFSLRPDGTATVITFLGPFPKDPGAKIMPNRVERDVSAEDASRLLQSVDRAGFWAMSTVESPSLTPPKYYVLDGAFWVFEGVRAGAYHVVYRRNPNVSSFTDMVHFLAKNLAKLDEQQIPPAIRPPISSSHH